MNSLIIKPVAQYKLLIYKIHKMGCGKSHIVALEELQDISNILKTEISNLEEEKEKLLYEQINRPAEDKEIYKSLKGMALEIDCEHKEAKKLLLELVEVISYQMENTPEIRMVQVIEMRRNLEEIEKKIENFYLQRNAYTRLNGQMKQSISQNIQDISEKKNRLDQYKGMCKQLNL